MVAACMDAYGQIDVLHNNVGGSIPGGAVEIDEADWDANIALNLKSVFLDGTMVDAQPPAIKQSGHAMHSWHDDVGRVATGGNGSRLVVIALVRPAKLFYLSPPIMEA